MAHFSQAQYLLSNYLHSTGFAELNHPNMLSLSIILYFHNELSTMIHSWSTAKHSMTCVPFPSSFPTKRNYATNYIQLWDLLPLASVCTSHISLLLTFINTLTTFTRR
jgi:hypothetical protein